MKKAISFAMSLALCSTGALANSSVLVPGKPAGVHQAQDTNTTVIVATLALAGLGIALAVSANNAGGPTTSTAGTSTSHDDYGHHLVGRYTRTFGNGPFLPICSG